MRVYSSKTFRYDQDFTHIDFRKHPEQYQVGIGEQGVLLVEPYKSEIVQFWRFRTPEIAEKSAKKIYAMFKAYKKNNDFVGMDMARKFLQMGYTRARRYANHPSGKKYITNPQKEITKKAESKAKKNIIVQADDWGTSEKAQSARIFYGYYLKAKDDKAYCNLKTEHKKLYG